MYIHTNTVTEALKVVKENIKAFLIERVEVSSVHAFHESCHIEIEEVQVSELPLRFDGVKFSIHRTSKIDEKLLSVEISHYNQLIGKLGLSDMIGCLSQNSTSKKAYKSFWSNENMFGISGEIPCVTGIHAYIKNNKVFFVTHMRSNNAYRLLEIDIYVGMALQVYLADQLQMGIGAYCHQVASLVVYNKDRDMIITNI